MRTTSVDWQKEGPDHANSSPTAEGINSSSVYEQKRETEPHVVVGIPAYNEEITIGTIVLTANQFADEVVIVDDGSTDSTAKIASQAGGTVIEHDTNRGKGHAVQTLLTYVRTNHCDVLVLIDGDGQHRPIHIPQLVERIWNDNTDIVIGSRYLDNSSDDETPLYRRFGQRVLDVLTTSISGVQLTDSQSGFRALSSKAIAELSLTTSGYEIETEMINCGAEKELSITEVPIDVRYEDVDGQTRNSLYHGLSVVRSILELFNDRHPTVFFGTLGIISVVVGLSYVTVMFPDSFSPLSAFFSGMFVLFGVLSLHTAFVINNVSRLSTGQLAEYGNHERSD